jgi:hypothetical protein
MNKKLLIVALLSVISLHGIDDWCEAQQEARIGINEALERVTIPEGLAEEQIEQACKNAAAALAYYEIPTTETRKYESYLKTYLVYELERK